jgi:hypothetical protein
VLVAVQVMLSPTARVVFGQVTPRNGMGFGQQGATMGVRALARA